MSEPLVTVIIVCHNQAPFLKEAIDSALTQNYRNLELIIVDDGSKDGSDEIIDRMEAQEKLIEKIFIPSPIGYCRAFNQALGYAQGKYIIDLAGDDILMTDRVPEGVSSLENSDARIDFCDAYYIDEHSNMQGTHYRRNSEGQLIEDVPEGNLFCQLLGSYFICSPTMMVAREVLDYLGGYDEQLYYEDFDFWVRSSRKYEYNFTNKVLVKKRVLAASMSKSQYLPNSKMLPSTFKVCEKAYSLCKTQEEYRALKSRIHYELRQAVISNNYQVAEDFNKLLGRIDNKSMEHRLWNWILAFRWDLSWMTTFIRKAR